MSLESNETFILPTGQNVIQLLQVTTLGCTLVRSLCLAHPLRIEARDLLAIASYLSAPTDALLHDFTGW